MLNRDRIGALLLLAFTLGYGALTFRIPLLPFQAQAAFTARTVPEALTLLGIGLCLILLIKPGRDPGESHAGYQWGRAAALCAVMVVYGLSLRPGGFLLSTGLFLIAGFLIMGERRWVLILSTAIPVVVLFWALMTQLLGVFIEPWPEFLRG
jgi:putative tricarboxylic transport membrane protein